MFVRIAVRKSRLLEKHSHPVKYVTPGFGPVYVVKAGTDLFRGLSFFEGLE